MNTVTSLKEFDPFLNKVIFYEKVKKSKKMVEKSDIAFLKYYNVSGFRNSGVQLINLGKNIDSEGLFARVFKKREFRVRLANMQECYKVYKGIKYYNLNNQLNRCLKHSAEKYPYYFFMLGKMDPNSIFAKLPDELFKKIFANANFPAQNT